MQTSNLAVPLVAATSDAIPSEWATRVFTTNPHLSKLSDPLDRQFFDRFVISVCPVDGTFYDWKTIDAVVAIIRRSPNTELDCYDTRGCLSPIDDSVMDTSAHLPWRIRKAHYDLLSSASTSRKHLERIMHLDRTLRRKRSCYRDPNWTICQQDGIQFVFVYAKTGSVMTAKWVRLDERHID